MVLLMLICNGSYKNKIHNKATATKATEMKRFCKVSAILIVGIIAIINIVDKVSIKLWKGKAIL